MGPKLPEVLNPHTLERVSMPRPRPGCRRWQARQPDPVLHGGGSERDGQRLQPVQVYIYGSLDKSPTELTRNYGTAWRIGGWLLTPFLGKIGAGRHAPAARAGGGWAEDHVPS
jgi:hypothetical protein